MKRKALSSTEKSKVMIFEKEKGRIGRREWKWREESIEEVNKMRYLEYILPKNRGGKKHIVERMRSNDRNEKDDVEYRRKNI